MSFDPVYVGVQAGTYHHTHDTEQGILVDFDKNGRMLGVEVLEPLFVTVGGKSEGQSPAGKTTSSTESENDVIPDENPQSMEVRICTKCDLRWDKHVDLATRTYWDDEGDKHVEHRQVTLLDCIELLKLANQGPMGPPGYQGAKGDTGEKGKDGVAFPFQVSTGSNSTGNGGAGAKVTFVEGTE